MLITDATKSALVNDYSLREIDRVRAVGKEHAITIFEVLNGLPDEERTPKERNAPLLHTAMVHYRAGAAKEGLEALQGADDDDPVVTLYRNRCAALLRDGVPPGWDGVTILDRK